LTARFTGFPISVIGSPDPHRACRPIFVEKAPKAVGYGPAAAALVAPAGALVSAAVALFGLARAWHEAAAMDGGGAVMVPATAIGLLLAACALLLVRPPRGAAARSIGRLAAAATLVLGLVVVGQYAADGEIAPVPGTLPAGSEWWLRPPSPATGLGLIFIGASLLAFAARRVRGWADLGAAATLVVALTALTGHAYGASALYAANSWGGTAVSTAVALGALGLGVIFADPSRGIAAVFLSDSAGGYLLRRLMPVALLAPPLLGWLALTAEESGLVDVASGTALLDVSLVVLLVGLVVRQATVLHALDAERERLLARERTAREEMASIGNSIPQLAWMADRTGWIFWYNERWYEYTGTTVEQMQGWGWRKVHHPERVDRVVERIRLAFETGEPWEDTFPLRSKTGEYRWFLSRALPIKDADGKVLRWFGTNTDVTEQLEAAAERERLLEGERKAREQVANILESITDAFFAVDRDWRFTYLNREAERLLRRSRDELLGRGLWAEFPEAVGATFERQYRRAMTEQETVQFEEYYAPLGIWVDVRAFPAADGLSVYFRDVTARKLAEEAIRESEARFRALAENATAAIFVIDEESTIEFANPAVERIFGYAIREMLGRSITMLMPENQRPLHDAGMRRHLDSGRRKLRWEGVELPGLTKDGRVIPLEISMGEFVREGRHYFTGIAREITERKQAQEALRESEERYRLLADMIPQHIWTTEADGYHNYFSRRWYEYTGATPGQTQGEGWLALLHPADRQRTIARWQHSLRTGEPYAIEYRFRGADGTYSWFLGQAMPLRNEAGEVVRWFGTLTDISERKRLEEERERLFRKEQEARAEADRRRAELERVTESRARLIRGFSHDVRNPLGVADAQAWLLEDGRAFGELPEKQRDSVQRIRRSIGMSVRLIDDLLELARAEAGQIELKCVETDVGQLAREVAEDFRAQAMAAGLALDIRATEGVLAETDQMRARQILGNLLSNAVKYAPQGRITVDAAIRRAGAPGPGVWIAVSVADTGPGIPEDKREQIFQEFTRLDPEAQHGSGVGLAISRRIARRLGGDLTVQSEVGRGSTFTLWLPSAARTSDVRKVG
jgi:PAS domain S-box-containing protein